MTTEQVWYVPITFESDVVNGLSDQITQLIKDEKDSFVGCLETTVVPELNDKGISLLNGNGLMDLAISVRRIEDFFKDRFPGYEFGVEARLDSRRRLPVCVVVSGKSVQMVSKITVPPPDESMREYIESWSVDTTTVETIVGDGIVND